MYGVDINQMVYKLDIVREHYNRLTGSREQLAINFGFWLIYYLCKFYSSFYYRHYVYVSQHIF